MRDKIYTGSTKTLHRTEEDNTLLMNFDDTLKIKDKETINIAGKGVINNTISSYLMQKIDMIGIDTHFIQKNNMRQQLIKFADIYPVQVHICTVASGRYVTEFDIENGFVFESPLIDFRVKNRELKYPVINEPQIINFGWLLKEELVDLTSSAIRVHDFLLGLFAGIGIRMVDIQLEFGRVFNGDEFIITLTDEISPDTCRLWDINNNEKLCFEIAEKNPEQVITAYQEVLRRLNIKSF